MKLDSPLKTLLRDPLDEAMANRVLRGMRLRRAELARPLAQRRMWVLGLMVLLFCGALAGSLARRAALSRAEPLAVADGTKFEQVEAGSAPLTMRLGDGSLLILEPGARLTPVINAPNLLVLRVIAGTVTFDVRPGGPRHWLVEGGLASIEVTGTRFTVRREQTCLSVEVTHGVVLMRGEHVPEGLQRLSAGERLIVADQRASADPPTPPREIPPTASSSAAILDRAKPRSPLRASAHRSSEAVSALLASADQARAADHPEQAAEALLEITEHFGSDARAAGAAFTLGKVRMDKLEDWTGAERAFAKAISLGLPESLQEDAYERLVEARARAGDSAGARRAIDAYLARYPNGSRVRAMQRWLEGP